MIEDAAHSVRPVTVLLRVLGVAAGVLVSGCAHESADRQFAQMRDEIARIQADHDRFDNRLSVLEVRSASPLPASSGSPPARAEARVVHIDPESQEPQSIDDAADGGVRSIVLRGTGESHKKARGVESYPEGSAESDPSRPTALDANARKAYDDALHLAQAHSYSAALDAFAAFLVRWPDHPYTPNANYWRGECYSALGDQKRAIEQFEAVVARSLSGNKVPDALYKLAVLYEKAGNREKAKEMSERLRREFPRSEAARHLGSQPTKEK